MAQKNGHGANFEFGKAYSITYTMSELERLPEIKLGHVVINKKHLYHVNKDDLDVINKKVQLLEAEGKNVYFKQDDEYIKISDVFIFSIIDPFDRFVIFEPFYKSFIGNVRDSLEKTSKPLAADADDVIREVIKVGLVEGWFKDISLPLDKDRLDMFLKGDEHFEKALKEFRYSNKQILAIKKTLVRFITKMGIFTGMAIYFRRKEVSVRIVKIFDWIERVAKTYVIFKKIGSKEEMLEEIREEKEFEKYERYVEFYEGLEKYIAENITKFRTGKVQVSIGDIINEAKKQGIFVEHKGNFIKGLMSYFNKMGLETKTDKTNVYFKRVT